MAGTCTVTKLTPFQACYKVRLWEGWDRDWTGIALVLPVEGRMLGGCVANQLPCVCTPPRCRRAGPPSMASSSRASMALPPKPPSTGGSCKQQVRHWDRMHSRCSRWRLAKPRLSPSPLQSVTALADCVEALTAAAASLRCRPACCSPYPPFKSTKNVEVTVFTRRDGTYWASPIIHWP